MYGIDLPKLELESVLLVFVLTQATKQTQTSRFCCHRHCSLSVGVIVVLFNTKHIKHRPLSFLLSSPLFAVCRRHRCRCSCCSCCSCCSSYIYIYIYIYIYTYICMCICICICICLYVYKYIYIYTHMCVYIYIYRHI